MTLEDFPSEESGIELTNFTLQYILRKDHKIIKVNTISAHTFEELMVKLKFAFPWVGDDNMAEKAKMK